nr:MAG TPA: Cytosine specific methyltransferase [Caudoviricetes sp.]
MKHLGDICKINGAEIEPVDCITGGSPCQDLSIAGKRAGLAGERSGLFMEQVRIVKEMRDCDRRNGRTGDMVRPRFLVWENVPGAFSSNGGGDFQAVLEEIIHIAEPTVSVPRFEGKWTKAGAIDGDGWSVAWRTHDAQYWGVPQRRRRISVVADFGGQSAGEILFERKGLPGDIAESGTARERLAGNAESGASYAVRIRGGCAEEQSPTLNAECGGNKPAVLCLNDQGGNVMGVSHDVSGTLREQEHGHQPTILDMSHACDVIRDCGEVDQTVQARMGTGGSQVPLTYQMQGFGDYREGNVASSCKQRDFKDGTDFAITNMAVRRLTPMECERLQGFQDGWTDIGEWIDEEGRTHKQADSPRYKALGNSIALPFWYWMFFRMAEHLPEKATLGSLFDGIGGFPLCWESIHGKGTARWASEIEKFPIAVTKLRFPEEA